MIIDREQRTQYWIWILILILAGFAVDGVSDAVLEAKKPKTEFVE